MRHRWTITALVVGSMGASGCSGDGFSGSGDTDVTPANAVEVGPFGAERELIEVDVGERTRGFSSKVAVLRAKPRALTGGESAVWAIVLPERDQDWEQYANTSAHLASWGFVVLVPQLDSLSGRRTDVELLQDLQALWRAVRENKVEADVPVRDGVLALAGHGRGGRLALAGATAIGEVGAVFAISPLDGDPEDPDQIQIVPGLSPQIDVPVGLFGAGRGADVADGQRTACTPEGRNYRSIWSGLVTDAIRVDLPDGGHGDIVEDCLTSSSDAICTRCRRGRDAIVTVNTGRAGMAAHFGARLRGDASLAAFWNTGALDSYAPGVRIETRRAGDPPDRAPEDTADRLDTAVDE